MLSKEWRRLGFTGKAFECRPNEQYLPDGDLCRPQVQSELYEDVMGGHVYYSLVAVTCTTWTLVRALGGYTPVSRNRDRPEGYGTVPAEVDANKDMGVAW